MSFRGTPNGFRWSKRAKHLKSLEAGAVDFFHQLIILIDLPILTMNYSISALVALFLSLAVVVSAQNQGLSYIKVCVKVKELNSLSTPSRAEVKCYDEDIGSDDQRMTRNMVTGNDGCVKLDYYKTVPTLLPPRQCGWDCILSNIQDGLKGSYNPDIFCVVDAPNAVKVCNVDVLRWKMAMIENGMGFLVVKFVGFSVQSPIQYS